MAGISELPSDQSQPQGQGQTQQSNPSAEELWDLQRRQDVARLIESSVMSRDAESIRFRGKGLNFEVSFNSGNPSQPTMHATLGSFMHNDPMSRPMPPSQIHTCSSHPFGHPQAPQSSGQFGHPFGGMTGQPFTQSGQSFGQPYAPQAAWPGLGSQGPQQPQDYFGQSFGSSAPPPSFSQGAQFGQSNTSFGQPPGVPFSGLGQFSSAPPAGPACCSVGSGFGHGMPTPPDTPGGALFGPGAPNVTQHTYDPNAPIWGSNVSSNTSNPWQQQSFGGPAPPQPPQFGTAFGGSSQGPSDPLNSAIRDMCASSCLTRQEVFDALGQASGCGLPGCGCNACQRANKLSVIASLIRSRPESLYSISRSHHHL
jgi:hypothetical protein